VRSFITASAISFLAGCASQSTPPSAPVTAPVAAPVATTAAVSQKSSVPAVQGSGPAMARERGQFDVDGRTAPVVPALIPN